MLCLASFAFRRRCVIEFIGELLINLIGEFLLELVFELVGGTMFPERDGRREGCLFAILIIVVGAFLGAMTLFIWPTRVTPAFRIPGMSLVASPLIIGLLMQLYGNWREKRIGLRTPLATFWGGALFAFAMALTRFLLVS